MMIDARTVDDGAEVQADIAIVGGGPAGLSIAQALIGRRQKVVLLEAGGLAYDAEDQALYEGENVGLDYYPLDSARLRYLGGSTNHWGGWCTPYRDHALEPWPWIPGSGWPISWSEIEPYVLRAAALIGLPPEGWDSDYWATRLGTTTPPFTPGVFGRFTELVRKKRFGPEIGPVLERDPGTTLYLHANLVAIETDPQARAVTGLVTRTRVDGRTLRVRASRYVLACGGIENARHLLLADQVAPGGLGNAHDLVGRYFADHVTFLDSVLLPIDPSLDVSFFERHRRGNLEVVTQLVLPFETARREGLLRTMLRLEPIYDPAWDGTGMSSLRAIRAAVLAGRMPDGLGRHVGNIARHAGEMLGLGWRTLQHGQLPVHELLLRPCVPPAPNRDSRVMLGDTVDRFGLRQVKLDFRLSPVDKRSARHMVETFAAEAAAAGLGRVRTAMNDDDSDFTDVAIEPGYHHMCTTRMADDPRDGVVDRNCRVHGIDNLYCAGSSVFSSAGDGSPTMMLVALALRLADHLVELDA